MNWKKRRYIALAAAVLVAVVAGGAAVPFIAHSSTGGSAATAAHAQTQYERVTVHYRRYGPASALIAPSNGPETIVTRMVYSFDSDGTIASASAVLEDATGNVLERASLDDGQTAYQRAGEAQHLQIHAFTADSVRTRARAAADRKRDGLASGELATVSQDDDLIVVRAAAGLPYINVGGGAALPADAYTIPYVADLDASGAYAIIVLDKHTLATLSMSTYAVTSRGDVLVESQAVVSDTTQAFERR